MTSMDSVTELSDQQSSQQRLHTGSKYVLRTPHILLIQPSPQVNIVETRISEQNSSGNLNSIDLYSNYIVTYKNLCISNGQLEIYNVTNTNQDSQIKLHVPVGEHIPHDYWDIKLKNRIFSKNVTYNNATAYFIKFSCADNLHHFFDDTYIGLYGAAKERNGLWKDKHVYFDGQKKNLNTSKCLNIYRYKLFVDALNVSVYADYKNLPDIQCYSRAVFGFTNRNVTNKALINNIVDKFRTNKTCPKNLILIQQRMYRRFVNLDEIIKTLKDAGYNNTVAVTFENITLLEQINLMKCVKVFIAIQGAGSEWLHFLQYPAGFIEVGWSGWPAGMYSDEARNLGYVVAQIPPSGINCHGIISQRALDLYTKGKLHVNDTLAIEDIKKNSLRFPFWDNQNIWKFADCIMSKSYIVESVERMWHILKLEK